MIPQIQIPDFTGTIQRGQALAQQGEMSRLQALALQRAADSDTRLNEAYAAAAPGLMAGSGPAFQSALLTLMRGGREGLAVALPLMQQQRERDEAASFWGEPGGGAPMPQASVPAPNGPISPSSDPVMLARAAAEERARIPRDAPDYEARIQAINDRLIAQAGPRGGSTSRTTSTTVPAMPGWDDGIPAPGAAPRATPASAPAGGAGGGRSGVSDGELRRIEMGLGSPNRIIQQQAQARLQMLQFRLRDSGQEPLVEIADSTSPTGRRLVQRSQAAGMPAPGPQGAQGPQASWYQSRVMELGPLVAAGTATPEQQQQYAVAATLWQSSGGQIADIPVNPNDPSAGTQRAIIPRALPPGFPPPPALGAQPAATPQAPAQAAQAPAPTPGAPQAAPAPGGVPIGTTGMTATPPDPNAPRIIGGVNTPNVSGEERMSAGYGQRMLAAEQRMREAIEGGYQTGNTRDAIASRTGEIGNFFMSNQGQLYRQAQEDWVRAKLRRESGAVIGEEEMAREIQTYFPRPGDSQEVIAQKERARQTANEAMIAAAGRAPVPRPTPTPRQQNMPRVNTIDEAMRLPPGTRFLDPNGDERIRP